MAALVELLEPLDVDLVVDADDAEQLSADRRIEGSNPSPSAQPGGAPGAGALLLRCGGLRDQIVQRIDVHARPQKFADLRGR
jgi:hypothetical protein